MTRELAGTLIDATQWAPTATNRQPVRWLVVMDPVEVRRLAGLTVDWLRQESTRFPQYSIFVDAWDTRDRPGPPGGAPPGGRLR